MNKPVIKTLYCSAALMSFAGMTQVNVQINGAEYNYADNPRLAEVLAPVALQAKWYWPAATLYKLSSNTAQIQREQLLQTLVDIKARYSANTELQTVLASIERQVKAWHLAERVTTPVDYDFARLREQMNPRFDSGSYLLKLPLRPQVVQVFGAVQREVAVTHQSSAPVSHYLPDIERSPLASDDEVILLQPDGSRLAVGVAYWNRQHIEAMPGAQLYIPFKTQLFSADLALLNQQLEQLAMHRILP
jgi:hypothetical protein